MKIHYVFDNVFFFMIQTQMVPKFKASRLKDIVPQGDFFTFRLGPLSFGSWPQNYKWQNGKQYKGKTNRGQTDIAEEYICFLSSEMF